MTSTLTLMGSKAPAGDLDRPTEESITRAKAAQLCERLDVERRCPEVMFDGDRLVRRAPRDEFEITAYALDRTIDVITDVLTSVKR